MEAIKRKFTSSGTSASCARGGDRKRMKWVTHQIVGAGAAVLAGLPPLAVGAAWLGSIAPDVIDQKVAGLFPNERKAFYAIHRRTTHWLGWWLAIWIAAFAAPGLARLVPGLTELPVLMAGLGLGGMAHVLLDMCTPSGVPLMPFSRTPRFSLNLCRTGSLGEYVFLAVALGVMWLIKGDELRPLLNNALRGLRHLAG